MPRSGWRSRTLFEFHYQRIKASGRRNNQKSINLDNNPFIEVFFPEANDFAAGQQLLVSIDLRIFGPDAHPVRKIKQVV